MFDSVQNSIWHAFDFLAVETNRVSAKKSKLKVRIRHIFRIFWAGHAYLLGTNLENWG